VRHKLRFHVHPGRYAVCRLDVGAALPEARGGRFWSVTRTPDEVSVVCEEGAEPPGARVESGWALIEIAGPFAFTLTGVLASVLDPLAEAGVGVFTLSTFDTDWVLVPAARLEDSVRALAKADHMVF
jgi:hypothetical protein